VQKLAITHFGKYWNGISSPNQPTGHSDGQKLARTHF